jgi:hypothetical protein
MLPAMGGDAISTNLPLVIPKPGSPARNLLHGGSKTTADSSRDNAALRNDNSFWVVQITRSCRTGHRTIAMSRAYNQAI